MKNIAKKKIKKSIEYAFKYVKNNYFYKKIKKIPIIIRIMIFVFFLIWFFVATILIPPIPFGNISLVLGLVIIFPIKTVKSKFFYIFQKLRVHQYYAKRMKFKHNRNKL